MTKRLGLTAEVFWGLEGVMCLRFCGQEFEDVSHGLVWRGLTLKRESNN